MKFTPRTTRAAVLLACFIFLLQATPLLHTRWVEDENWYGSIGYSLHTEGRLRNPVFPDTDIESHVDTHPPGTAIAVAADAALFGVGTTQFRISSIMAGLGLVLAFYLLGAELLCPAAGAVAALLAATDTFVLLAARTVRPEVFVACFTTLAVWLFFRARRTNSTLLALLSGLFVGLAMNFHPNGLAICASLCLLLLLEFRIRIFRAPRFWAFVAGSVSALVPFVTWIVSSPERIQAFRALWGRGSQMTAGMLLTFEKARYSDFLGLGSSRVPLPVPLPVRIHIVAAIAIAAFLLWRSNRMLLGEMLVLMIPSMLFWPIQVNPASRFFAILEPYIVVMLVAGAMEFGKSAARMRVAMALLLVIGLSQIAGNAYFLWRSRAADYRAVTSSLRAIVPPAAKVYGALTFWLAFYDRPFYSFNRVPLGYALRHGVQYLVTNDRVMVNGTGYGDNFYEPLREQVNAFTRSHCQLAGKVSSAFYGDLEIYRVLDPNAEP